MSGVLQLSFNILQVVCVRHLPRLANPWNCWGHLPNPTLTGLITLLWTSEWVCRHYNKCKWISCCSAFSQEQPCSQVSWTNAEDSNLNNSTQPKIENNLGLVWLVEENRERDSFSQELSGWPVRLHHDPASDGTWWKFQVDIGDFTMHLQNSKELKKHSQKPSSGTTVLQCLPKNSYGIRGRDGWAKLAAGIGSSPKSFGCGGHCSCNLA